MMNGYSVTEAASVLGVPTERVWELLARGVLAGAPEGETGMRVFLQPRSAPAPVTATPDEDLGASRSNGPEHELSPFRELLTEFRNLTERYGQALLALGESRGEVAALRSRVDLLEARIDLRLPMGSAAGQWPTQPTPTVETPHADVAVEPEGEEGHRPRRRGARRATESFAEALARAEDPSPADLPSGIAAGMRAEAIAEDADRSIPRDVLPAESVLVAEEAGSDAVADVADAAPPPTAIDAEPGAEKLEPIAFEPPPVIAEPEPVGVESPVATWDEPEPREPLVDEPSTEAGAVAGEADEVAYSDAGWTTAQDGEPQIEEPVEALTDADPTLDERPSLEVESIEVEPLPDLSEERDEAEPWAAQAEVEPAPALVAEAEPAPVAEGAADASDFDADRYTSVIEQPDWFEAEVDDAGAGAPAAEDAWQPPADVSTAEPTASETSAEAWPDEPEEGKAPDEPMDASPAEAAESGADEMEVAGGGQLALEPPGETPEPAEETADEPGLPGSRELDEALEAFGEVAPRIQPTETVEEEWPPAPGGAERFRPTAQHSTGFETGRPRPTYGSAIPGSPATRAYRRLRRIFPT